MHSDNGYEMEMAQAERPRLSQSRVTRPLLCIASTLEFTGIQSCLSLSPGRMSNKIRHRRYQSTARVFFFRSVLPKMMTLWLSLRLTTFQPTDAVSNVKSVTQTGVDQRPGACLLANQISPHQLVRGEQTVEHRRSHCVEGPSSAGQDGRCCAFNPLPFLATPRLP